MQELEHLRNEMGQHSSLYHEHYQKASWNVIMLWSGVLILFTALSKDNIINIVDMGAAFWFFILITIFFISVVTLYISSQRGIETMEYMQKIGAYITVFHEGRPKSDISKDKQSFWWLSTFEIMKNDYGTPKWKRNNIMCKQPFVYSLFAVIMEVTFFIFMITMLCKNKNVITVLCENKDVEHLALLMVIICFIYIIVSVYLLFPIGKNVISNTRKWYGIKKTHLRTYIKYAIGIGYYTEDKVKETFGKDFWQEVMYGDDAPVATRECVVTCAKSRDSGSVA